MTRCAYAIDLGIAMPIKIREELVKLDYLY